jgi:two-component system LytT family sensor kinase
VKIDSQSVRRTAIAYFWSIVLWLSFSPIMAGQDEVRLAQRGLHSAFGQLLLADGAWLFTSALLTPPMFAIVRRYPINRQALFKRVGGYLLFSIPYLVASMCTRWIILPPWNIQTQQFDARSFHSLIGNIYFFGNQIWDYLVTLVAAHAYGYFTRVQNQELERAVLQRELAASELQALKGQLHPHFLFNTLQGISALIDRDRERAKAMVLRLSGLLRTALEYANSDLITLDEELKFVQDYLDIEKMRLAERLDVRWKIQPSTRQLLVPQMILQPMVQNAIVHGIACCREGGWLEVASRRTNGTIELSIENSVGGSDRPGLGLGLQNTRSRLRHLYGEEGILSFQVTHDRIAKTTLLLPALGSRNPESAKVAAGERLG